MGAAPDDWRRTGQDKFLSGARLTWKNYQALSVRWEHEHCVFCFRSFLDPAYSDASRAKLADEPDQNISAGYTTLDADDLQAGQLWICEHCFKDFNEEFDWTVEATDPTAWPYQQPEPERGATCADYQGR